ncbi:Flp family type IVb pilin [Actibacterium sp.]|uniref:Flp family type IVb pilin n=1 Tax=Actibacterium sp. TaxID=1872125 RepID=UPI00356A23CA
MKLFEMIKNFHNDESGAVTVDWVVLTAAVVGLGFAVIYAADDGMTTLATAISTELSAVTPSAGN